MKRSRTTKFLVLVSLFLSAAAWANSNQSPLEDLATHLPDEVVGFIGTSGGGYLEPSFKESTLGQIWYDPGVVSFRKQVYQQLLKAASRNFEEPGQIQQILVVEDLLEKTLSCPCLLGIYMDPQQPFERTRPFMLIDAGGQKDEINRLMDRVEDQFAITQIADVQKNREQRVWKFSDHEKLIGRWHGNLFGITVADANGDVLEKIFSGQRTGPVFGQVSRHDDIVSYYINIGRITEKLKATLAEEGRAESIDIYQKVMKSTGLDRLRYLSVRSGFAGKDVVADSLIKLSGSPTGLLACSRPLDTRWITYMDRRSVQSSCMNFDLSKAFSILVNAADAIDESPDRNALLQQVVKLEKETGIELQEGILGNLRGHYVFNMFAVNTLHKAANGGSTVFVELKDGKAFEEAMVKLEEFVGRKLNKEMENGLQIQFSTQIQPDGSRLHVWGIAPLAMLQYIPCWMVVGDTFIMATQPSLCVSTATRLKESNFDDIALSSSRAYQSVKGGLPKSVFSLRFDNSRLQMQTILMSLQQMWPMVTMAAAQEGIQLPFLLPQLDHISQNANDSWAYGWTQADGIGGHYKGSGIPSSDVRTSAGGIAMGSAILLPALGKVKELAGRIVSASNLKAIGMAATVYANDHDGRFPPKYEVLVNQVEPDVLEAPHVPDDAQEPGYIYVEGLTYDSPSNLLLLYENPKYRREGVNVFYVDGRVEWITKQGFKQTLESTYQYLGRPVPEIQFNLPGQYVR